MCHCDSSSHVPVTLPAFAHAALPDQRCLPRAFSTWQTLHVQPLGPGSGLLDTPHPQSSSRQALCLQRGRCPLISRRHSLPSF